MKKIFACIILLLSHFSYAQNLPVITPNQIYNKIEKLNFLGSVLYVAAHPDDENTALISYYSNYVHAQVGYISLTRGDGGQNLIGSEIRELLGVIRTEELLAARKLDGGHQFFSRANDFGYSKRPEETFSIWEKDKVLSDLVYVIRKFKPDVLINRFDHRTPGTTHGHHTASALLSLEAFEMAADKNSYPEQLKEVEVWQPKRLFYNTSWWFYGSQEKFQKAMKATDFFRVNVGKYYPTLGLSNTEISALSRSQHKSQGFGVAGSRGEQIEYLEPVAGKFPDEKTSSVFSGIKTDWSRVKNGEKIGLILKKVQNEFDFKNPEKSIPALLKAYRLIEDLEEKHWRELKLSEIKEIISDCLGFYLQVYTNDETAVPGQDIDLNLEAINRSSFPLLFQELVLKYENDKNAPLHFKFQQNLENNVRFSDKITVQVPENIPYSTPYWLNNPYSDGMYTVEEQNLIGLPESPKPISAVFHFQLDDFEMIIKRDIVYKTSSPSEGEIIKPFSIVPEISVSMNDKTLVFADNSAKEIEVTVKSYKDNMKGKISLETLSLEKDWEITPDFIEIDLPKKGMNAVVKFHLQPNKSQTEEIIVPKFETAEKTYNQELHLLDYKHIQSQTVLLPARLKANRIDIQKKGNSIGYIIGAGDEVPASLRAIGYEVTEFLPSEITAEKLQSFDAVVLGIRAYDLDNNLPLYQNVLFEYVKKGGTLINQYNSLRELKTDKLAPYELEISHDRVTDENSPVRFLEKNHPVLNVPNKITEKDFENWVQERGLYFPNKWDKEFVPILGMNDKGEEELKSALLIAQYGKGHFVYTGLSFFRELPAGVPGAYRLFANLLSLGKQTSSSD